MVMLMLVELLGLLNGVMLYWANSYPCYGTSCGGGADEGLVGDDDFG